MCHKIYDERFMRSNYSVTCDTSWEWLKLLPFVLTMLIGFTAGFPLMVAYYFRKHRFELYGAHAQGRYGWMYRPFRPGVEWWEVHEIMRRMILTGVLIYFPQHIRAAIGVVICTFAILNLNYFKPHKDPALFWISQSSFVVTLLCYVCAILVKTAQNDQERRDIGKLLVGLNISFVASSFVCGVLAIWVMRNKIAAVSNICSYIVRF